MLVGLPVSLSGTEEPQAAEVRDFVAKLSERVRVPVETWDERFTTEARPQTHARTVLRGLTRRGPPAAGLSEAQT